MSGTIFDLVEEDPKTGHEGFFQLAERAPEIKPKSFFKQAISRAKEFEKSAMKGGVEGLHQLGRIMGPVGLSTEQEVSSELDEALPTDNESFGQRALRRGLKSAPSALAFPGSSFATLPRALASGFLGEGAKDLGLPEWAQTAAEITAFVGPDVTKKLLTSGKNAELIEAGRKLGLNDKQLTPLLQSEFKQKWLTQLSPKKGATQKALSDTKSALGESYSKLQSSAQASKELNPDAIEKFKSSVDKIKFDMPSGVREVIEKDFQDLLSKPITGSSLMNFYADINHNLGPSAKQLTLLKGPVREAIKTASPELGKDFEMLNSLYSKYYPIASRLKTNLASDIIGAAEQIGMIGAITTGHYPFFLKIMGEKAARKLAQQMLINPRLQQLSGKVVDAINQSKPQIAKKVMDEYIRQVGKKSPEAANKMGKLVDDELEELFNHQENS